MRRFNHWEIAYRKEGESEFKVVSNPWWGWAADPFLVKHDGQLYLFAELFLYNSERNGVIGYCVYGEDGFGDWTVSMDKHWHISYPNVWEQNGMIYMCPETYQADEVAIYKLVDFPNKWEKDRVLIKNGRYVDSTFAIIDDKQYLFTYRLPDSGQEGKLLLCSMDEDWNILSSEELPVESLLSRPGGKVMYKEGKIIRVSQDCEKAYGTGLIFSEINMTNGRYIEKEIKRIYVGDIEIKANPHRDYTGVHTYNCCEGIEVIDLKYISTSLKELVASKRVRKVFTNKY